MPNLTTVHKIPYPLDSERLEAYPAVARQAAQIIDAAMPKTRKGQCLMPTGHTRRTHQQGNLYRIGNTVFFEGLGFIGKTEDFRRGVAKEMGTIIPAGFRPAYEVAGVGVTLDQGIARAVSMVIRANGTLFVRSGESDFTVNSYSDDRWLYNYIAAPALTWQTNDN